MRNPGPAVGLLAQLVALAVLVPLAGLGPVGFAAGAVYGLGLAVLLAVAYRRAGTSRPTPADVVTSGRAVLVGCVTALVADSAAGRPPVPLLAIAAVALALDLLDGQVARRTGTVSELGARFDMEVDAFLILVLSVVAARWLGWWVLASGAMRYAFVAAGRLRPWLRRTVPPTMIGKTVAAVQGVTLLVVGSRLLPRPFSMAAAALALALLTWSFGRSTWWLIRHRTRP